MMDLLKEKLINFFRDGEKEHDNFTVGAEFEHFIVDKETFKAIPFTGENGIETVLKELLNKGWEGIYENEYLVGLKQNGSTITLEPGCQFELSVKSSITVKEIEETYMIFLKDLFPILEKRGQVMIAMGYQPASKIAEIEFNPKKRYEFMAKYLKEKGQYAHNMMKGSAATQVTIDYAHQDDFRKKFQVAYALSPVIYALFDNSPIFEGEEYQGYALRRKIWDQCDDQRCVLNNVLKRNYGYEDYAEFVLNSAPILVKENNDYVYTGDKTVSEIYADGEISEEQIEHVLTMVFPDIRLKKFIEIRMADALPYPLNLAYVALIKSLFYNKDNLDALYEFVMTINDSDVEKAKKDILEEGMEAKFGEGTVRDIAKDLFFMAGNQLNQNEVHYLQPLEAVIFKEVYPKDVTKKQLLSFN